MTNGLAGQIVGRDVEARDVAVTAAHVDSAKETIILEWRSRIASRAARLREPRVRRILAPMLTGDRPVEDQLDDDRAYAIGLSLVAVRRGFGDIANRIYREVIPRALTYAQPLTIPREAASFVRADGSFDA